MIPSKLTCDFTYVLFQHVVAWLWYPFVLSHQCYFIFLHTQKMRDPCPSLLACVWWGQDGGRKTACQHEPLKPGFMENRGWWELRTYSQSMVAVLVDGKVRLTPIKKIPKCSSECFPLISLTQKSLWSGEVDFCQRVFLKTFLSCFWQLRSWRGFYLKPLALRLGC